MGRHRIGKGTYFYWKKSKYQITSNNGDSFEIRNLEFGVEETIQRQEFLKCLKINAIILPKIANGKKDTEKNFNEIAADEYKKSLERAHKRLQFLEPLLSSGTKNFRKAVDDRVIELENQGFKVSRSSLYQWRKDYIESNCDITSLMDNYHKCGGPGEFRLESEVKNILDEFIEKYFLIKRPFTMDAIYKLVKKKISTLNKTRELKLRVPSLSTIQRYIKHISEYEKIKSQYSKLYVQSKFGQFKQVPVPTRPLEMVQADSHTLDVVLLDDTTLKPLPRAYLTVIIDVFTRYPLGYNISFDPPSYESVMLALRHAIEPKTEFKTQYPDVVNPFLSYGMPELLILDNGKEFDNQSLKNFCDEYGIEYYFCPPREAWKKGVVERFFKTLITQFIHMLPGTTHSNTVEKKNRDTNPQKEAAIRFSTFKELFAKWLLDRYANDFHEGINDIPMERWKEATQLHEPDLPDSMEKCRLLLLPLFHEKRTIQKEGLLEWENKKYKSHSTLEIFYQKGQGEQVSFRYDPSDISKIYVYDHLITKDYIEVPCFSSGIFSGMSRATFELVYQDIKGRRLRVNEETILDSLSYMTQKIEEDIGHTKTVSREQARLRTKGSNQKKSKLETAKEQSVLKQKVATRKRSTRLITMDWGEDTLDLPSS